MWTLKNECGLVTLQNVRNVSNVTLTELIVTRFKRKRNTLLMWNASKHLNELAFVCLQLNCSVSISAYLLVRDQIRGFQCRYLWTEIFWPIFTIYILHQAINQKLRWEACSMRDFSCCSLNKKPGLYGGSRREKSLGRHRSKNGSSIFLLTHREEQKMYRLNL